MKPITTIIPLLAMLCGCEKNSKPVTREELKSFQARLHDYAYDVDMRLNALETEVFTNDVPPGTIRIPAGDHVTAPILIKKRTEPGTNRWDIKGVKLSYIYDTNYGIHLDRK